MCVYCGDSVIDATPDCENLTEWYAKHHPKLRVGSRIPDACSDCRYQYTAGEQITIRGDSDSILLDITVIAESQGLPDMIVARHPDGRHLCFAKTQIRLVPNPKEKAPSVEPKKLDGYF